MVPLPSTKEMKRACSEALLCKDVFSNNSPFVKVEKIETHKEEQCPPAAVDEGEESKMVPVRETEQLSCGEGARDNHLGLGKNEKLMLSICSAFSTSALSSFKN